MSVLNYFFGDEIEARVNRALAGAYNSNVFKFLNDNQVILNEDDYDYARAYKVTGAVYECVDLIIKKIIACPRLVYRIKDKDGYKVYKNLMKSPHIQDRARAYKLRQSVLEEIKVPGIQKLLDHPNSKQNGDEFIRMLAGLYLLRGNAYIYGNAGDLRSKKWTELFALPADMKIVSGGMFEPIKGYYLHYNTAEQIEFPVEQIKHIKTFNPFYSLTGTHLYGLSPLSAYLYSIEGIKQADIQGAKQLKNGGKIGFISPKNKEDQLGTDQKKNMKEGIVQAHASKESYARIIPSSVPLDWTEIGLSSADMQLIETKGVNADDIYLGYHVPLQFRRNDASSYNNLTVASKQFLYNAVAPIADEISQALTDFICLPYEKADGQVYEIKIDYSSLPELAADLKELTDWLAKSWEITPNERRELKGFGRMPDPGMDKVLVPKNYVLLDDVVSGKANMTSGATGPGTNPADTAL